MSGIYDLILSPGESKNLGVLGSFVKVVEAPTGAISIKLDGGEGFALLEGQGLRLADGKTFRDLTVRNAATLAQTVQIFIGDARFEDTRITGNVRVIDQAADKTLLNKQFIGSVQVGGVASVFSSVNLLANAARVAVHTIIIDTAASTRFSAGPFSGPGTNTPSVNNFENKNALQSASLMRYGTSNLAAVDPTAGEVPGYKRAIQPFVAASAPARFELKTPIFLSGTQGYLFVCQTAATGFVVTVEFEEL